MDADLAQWPRVHHPLVDGHTHIDQFTSEEIPQLLERAHAASVGLIISAGTSIDSCRRLLVLADSYPIIHVGLGLHPADLTGWVSAENEAELRDLASHPKVVEWSETGLDYMPNSPPHDLQQDAFRKQIRIAKGLGLPIVIHSREADADTLRLLNEEGAGEVGGAWHYFQGDLELAERVIDLGFYISLAKPLLRIPELEEAVKQIPLQNIVIETDSYPQPFKKNPLRRTEPWHLPQVAEKLAAIQQTDIETVASTTTTNYLQLLNGRIDPEALPLPISEAP